jgi:hypothetical protein
VRAFTVAFLALFSLAAATLAARQVDVLQSTRGIPAHLAGMFEEAVGFQQTDSGQYFVFDRRAQAIYGIDEKRTTATKLVSIGPESGRVLGPTAFDTSPNGLIVVADAPNGVERIQFFNERGEKAGGFSLPGRTSARVTLGPLVLNGVGSLQFGGRSILINQPETGALVTEYGLAGTPLRTFGALRLSPDDEDRDLQLAFNVGLPLIDPTGGFYFVFQTGEPRFRKYTAEGTLVFDRVAQGRELDDLAALAPRTWPRREVNGERLPIVPPVVRTAAVDPEGRLWISFVVPFTYVYDRDGDLVRTVQFKGADLITPNSLFFAGRTRLLVTPGLYEFRVDWPAPGSHADRHLFIDAASAARR